MSGARYTMVEFRGTMYRYDNVTDRIERWLTEKRTFDGKILPSRWKPLLRNSPEAQMVIRKLYMQKEQRGSTVRGD